MLRRWMSCLMAGILLTGAVVACSGEGDSNTDPGESISTTAAGDDEETGGAAEAPETEEPADTEEPDTEEPESEEPADTEDEADVVGDVTIEETVVVDQDGVKITVQELIVDDFWGPELKLLIENDTEQNLVHSLEYLVINNYMVTDLFVETVSAGKKANATLRLLDSQLEEAGITDIAEIAFAMRVYDKDSYDDLFTTEELVLQTSAYADYSYVAMDEGEVLVDAEGVRVVASYLDEDSFWGPGLMLFIENTNDANVRVSVDDLSINGFMFTPFFSTSVNSGRAALRDLTVFESELEENSIEVIEEMELAFRISDADEYETIYESDPVTYIVE